MKNENMPKRYEENKFDSFDGFYVTKHTVTRSKLHWHDFFEFELIISGNGVSIINGVEKIVNRGKLIFLTPSDFHETIANQYEDLSIINVHFNNMFISEKLMIDLQNFSTKIMEFDLDTFLDLEREFIKLLNEYNVYPFIKKELIKNYIDRIILIIFKSYYNKEINSNSISKDIELALDYIENHFRENITLQNVADLCNFTPSYFSVKFRKKFGETFQNYLLRKRLYMAEKLIKSTDLAIEQICYESGFQCPIYFTRAFKKQYKITPSKMKKNIS